jgi:H/ACA ribonucleoprotein complex subunit 3
MKSKIRVCSTWKVNHDKPVYTLLNNCPICNSETINSSPAPFGPEDHYGVYRRRLKRKISP